MKQVDFPPKGEWVSSSPGETEQLGEKILYFLKPGSIVALHGNLGSGKTVFTRGIARALEINEEITSPTYTIINEYNGSSMPLYHMDTYRLTGNEDFSLTGAEELLYGKGVCVVEWPEKITLPKTVINVEILILENGKRLIRYEDRQ